jgi:hypothetical protein
LLSYVWRQWEFKPAKLAALQAQLLSTQAEVAGGQPLLKMEHLRMEDDFLGGAYGLGIISSLSFGLPDLPQGTFLPKLACQSLDQLFFYLFIYLLFN